MLTPQEKAAGRLFREQASSRMESLLPVGVVTVPDTLSHVRHLCSRHPGRTWALYLAEHYILSPEMKGLAPGRLAWLWKYGSCSCGYAARSAGGWMVETATRPPMRGARQEQLAIPMGIREE